MNTFTINITDELTGQPVEATLTYLDGNGQAVLNNGQPFTASTDATGIFTFTAQAATLQVRISAPGYVSQDVTLNPGTTAIKLNGPTGPTATITAAKAVSFMERYKVAIVLAILAALFLLLKTKLLK